METDMVRAPTRGFLLLFVVLELPSLSSDAAGGKQANHLIVEMILQKEIVKPEI